MDMVILFQGQSFQIKLIFRICTAVFILELREHMRRKPLELAIEVSERQTSFQWAETEGVVRKLEQLLSSTALH